MSINSPLLRALSPKMAQDPTTSMSNPALYNRLYSSEQPLPVVHKSPPSLRALHVAYKCSLLLNGIATTLTIASIYFPGWFRGRTITALQQDQFEYSYLGLGIQCLHGQACSPFPTLSDCRQYGSGFCAAWQTSAFAMWIALVLQTTSDFALFFTIFLGSKPVLHSGWRLIAMLTGMSVVFELASTITMAELLETCPKFHGHDHRHWILGSSWAFATTSWVLELFVIVGLTIVGIMSNDGGDIGELYDEDEDIDFESITTDGERDDFYYYNRQTRRNYLACNN